MKTQPSLPATVEHEVATSEPSEADAQAFLSALASVLHLAAEPTGPAIPETTPIEGSPDNASSSNTSESLLAAPASEPQSAVDMSEVRTLAPKSPVQAPHMGLAATALAPAATSRPFSAPLTLVPSPVHAEGGEVSPVGIPHLGRPDPRDEYLAPALLLPEQLERSVQGKASSLQAPQVAPERGPVIQSAVSESAKTLPNTATGGAVPAMGTSKHRPSPLVAPVNDAAMNDAAMNDNAMNDAAMNDNATAKSPRPDPSVQGDSTHRNDAPRNDAAQSTAPRTPEVPRALLSPLRGDAALPHPVPSDAAVAVAPVRGDGLRHETPAGGAQTPTDAPRAEPLDADAPHRAAPSADPVQANSGEGAATVETHAPASPDGQQLRASGVEPAVGFTVEAPNDHVPTSSGNAPPASGSGESQAAAPSRLLEHVRASFPNADVRIVHGPQGETLVSMTHPTFGAVELNVQMTQGGLDVAARVDGAIAANLLRRSEATLRKSIHRRGLSLGRLRVERNETNSSRRRIRGIDLEA